MIVPTAITFLCFSVLGGSALHRELFGGGGLIGPDGAVDTEAALFGLLGDLRGGILLMIGAILLIAIFFITSSDSGALVMAMIASGGAIEPAKRLRVFFVFLTALLAIALLVADGLAALQTAAIIIALPFSLVMIAACWATVIAFQREARA